MAGHLLGIDLGTSSVRAGVYRTDGSRAGIAARTYPILTPAPGVAEQDPNDWWKAASAAIREALAAAGTAGSDIAGISFSSQMHGGVLLDDDGVPLGNAIIWADARSADECAEVEEIVGREQVDKVLMNRVFPGTLAATIRWMQRHDPDRWRRTRHILCPSDYLRFRMCGLYNTDPSAASATLLFDQNTRDWSGTVLDALNIAPSRLPYVVHSDQYIAGTEGIEAETGLPDGVPVIIGGADQPCAAFGNGLLDEGTFLATIGTGGQLFAPTPTPMASPGLSLNTFCHLPENRWYVLGATLAGGLSLRWFRDTLSPGVPFETLSSEAEQVPPGADGLLFRPYLAGARSPVLDPTVGASFAGLRLDHTRGHVVRAIMEGVTLELRMNLAVMADMGLVPERIVLSGGAASSPVWTRIVADVFNRPVSAAAQGEQACLGAALMAGIGAGLFRDWREAAAVLPPPTRSIEPDPAAAARYDDLYVRFCDARGECLGPEDANPR